MSDSQSVICIFFNKAAVKRVLTKLFREEFFENRTISIGLKVVSGKIMVHVALRHCIQRNNTKEVTIIGYRFSLRL